MTAVVQGNYTNFCASKCDPKSSLNGRFRNVLFMFYTLVLSFIFAFEIWGSANEGIINSEGAF